MKLTRERKNQTELNKLEPGNPTVLAVRPLAVVAVAVVAVACPSKTGSADGLSLPCLRSLACRRHLSGVKEADPSPFHP